MAVASARTFVLEEKNHYDHENIGSDRYTKLEDGLPAQIASLGLRVPTKASQGFALKRLGMADKEDVIKFFRKFFYRDEPMNKAIDLLPTEDSRCPELEEYSTFSLAEGLSVAVVDDAGDIVGVTINGLARKQCVPAASEEIKDLKFSRIRSVLQHLDTESKVWEKVSPSCDSIMEVRIASTHEEWRGRGLMRIMCNEAERIAKELGACAMRMDTTSAFSAAVAERLNYRMVYSIRYSELPDAPQPPPPHLEARVYIKEL